MQIETLSGYLKYIKIEIKITLGLIRDKNEVDINIPI